MMEEYKPGALLELRTKVFALDVHLQINKWVYPDSPIMVLEYVQKFNEEILVFLSGERIYIIENFDFALTFKPCISSQKKEC